MGFTRRFHQVIQKMASARQPNARASLPQKRADAISSLKAYWVGHSLMQGRAQIDNDKLDLMEVIDCFAHERELDYQPFDHTLFGAPLSLQWRGETHSYSRHAPEQAEKSRVLNTTAQHFDHFIFTEVVPVKNVFKLEFSAFYLNQFAQCIRRVNPEANIFLYESWEYLNGGKEPQIADFDWYAAMQTQRTYWEKLADQAYSGHFLSPNLKSQCKSILGLNSKTDALSGTPIKIIPVGQCLMVIFNELKKDKTDALRLENGEALQIHHFFKNPYRPLTLTQQVPSLVNPEQKFDDIHASGLGVYLAALVHFTCLYRQNPQDLSYPDFVGKGLALRLQTLVWRTVTQDPRSGLSA